MDAMLLVKATMLLAATLLAARLLGRASAATRHRLWTLAFAAVLALPVLAIALPPLRVPVLTPGQPEGGLDPVRTVVGPENPGPHVPKRLSDGLPMKAETLAPVEAAAPVAPHVGPTYSVEQWLLLGWLLGTSAAAITLLLSVVRAHRLAAKAEDLSDPAWRAAAADLAARLGLHRSVRLLVSPHVSTPMAGGFWRPVIFLPDSVREWSAEQREVVLAHEIAHLAGSDPLRHITARLAVALYWFHPLAWLAARQAAIAREQACDEAVLMLGTRPSAYARVLLALADSMTSSRPPIAVLPIVQRSLLEKRLMAILNDGLRPTAQRRFAIPAMGAALLTLTVAAAQPVARATSPASPARVPTASPMSSPAQPAAPLPSPPTIAPMVAPTVAAVIAQVVDTDRESACWWDPVDNRSFVGSISSTTVGGRSVIYRQVGERGADRVIQQTFGDLRVCALAQDVGDRGAADRPSQWPGRARRVILETRRRSTVQRLEIARSGGGAAQTSWRVGGTAQPFDAAAERWRDRLLATLDATWDLAMLRGEVSSLRGQISSIRGQQSSMRGEISSLRGQVSSMRGRISSIRGQESSLRGQISSIRGHVSSLRGAISSARGAISSINSSRYRATDDDLRQIATRIERHESEITRIEQDIRDYNAEARIADVEREIARLDTSGQIAAIEAEIRAFDLDGKIAATERRITDLDVDGKVATIERQIAGLDADRKGRELENRRDAELQQLEAAIAAIK